MSIEKIKSMTEILRKMEEMQKSVTEDVNKDINKKRKEALKKIRAYMDDVANALVGIKLIIHLEGDDNELIFGSLERGQRINFNCPYKIEESSAFSSAKFSEEPKNWYIDTYNGTKRSDTDFYYYIDNSNSTEREKRKGYWAEGFINLIENWSKIKGIIEREVEKQLTKRMEEIRKNTETKIESYEKVNDFEA